MEGVGLETTNNQRENVIGTVRLSRGYGACSTHVRQTVDLDLFAGGLPISTCYLALEWLVQRFNISWFRTHTHVVGHLDSVIDNQSVSIDTSSSAHY